MTLIWINELPGGLRGCKENNTIYITDDFGNLVDWLPHLNLHSLLDDAIY